MTMSGWGYRSQSFFINQTKYKNGERTMSLKETINNDIKTAMKAKDKETLAVLRMIKTAIQAAEIDKKSELTAEEELTILSREAKQRRDSIVEFEKANRPELVEKTQGELVIVEKYLPAQLSLEEVQEASYMAGSYDFLLKLILRDMKDYQNFVVHKISKLDIISNIQSAFVIQNIKNTSMIKCIIDEDKIS